MRLALGGHLLCAGCSTLGMIRQPRLTALVLTMNDFSHIYLEPEQIELLSIDGQMSRLFRI
jgi:hypothetical protein